jgi:hypothetical protein
MVKPEKNNIEKLLRRFIESSELPQEEIDPGEEKLFSDMVRQNILYFDPTEAKAPRHQGTPGGFILIKND